MIKLYLIKQQRDNVRYGTEKAGKVRGPDYPISDRPRRSRFPCLVSIHVLYVGTKLDAYRVIFDKILDVKHSK